MKEWQSGTAPDDLWLRKAEWVERCMYLSASQTGINYFTDASILAEGKKDLPVILLGPEAFFGA
ncbi:MAG: hypothetical protein ACLUUO_07120 [Sellimonas intestinalis]